jgi:ligand-binding sensor domain-containing protein
MKSVRAITRQGDILWAATGGGAFSFDPTTMRFQKYTVSDGLSSNDLTAVEADGRGSVWFGASDGSLSVFDGTWRRILDIAVSGRIQKSIRKFFPRNDSLFIASDFGISVYLISRGEFGDTYANFGFPTQAVVNSILIDNNRIWAATNQGVATALLSSLNLTSPTSWTTYGQGQGLPASNATSVSLFYDTLVVGTVAGASYFSNGSFLPISAFSTKQIQDVQQRGNLLYFLWNSGSAFTVETLAQLNGSSQVIASNPTSQSSSLLIAPNPPKLWASTARGIGEWDGTTWNYILPNGPQSNFFVGIAVDQSGVLWAGSGIDGRGQGFTRYDPSKAENDQWKNFTVSDYPILRSNDYYKVSVAPDNSVWVSSWGFGVVQVRGDSIIRRIDANSTPSLAASVPVDPNAGPFVVVGGVASDPEGKLWFANLTPINGNLLARLTSDSTFSYFRNPASEGYFLSLVIDHEGTKWLANSEPTKKNAKGLFFLNENKIVSGTDAAGWGFLSVADGLPNGVVMSLAVDQDGDVWVGTDLGVMIVTDPRFPKLRRSSSFPLREQSIQSIAVDGMNNKWVGTREGVFVVNSDGTQLIEQYTVLSTNGKLVSNDVRSIAIDQRRGIVYFGTEKGLSSLNIAAVQPAEAYSSLEVAPNPYTVPGDGQVVIRNLVANSTVKILTTNGLLVSQFKAQGAGRAFWDGKDDKGQYVSTGIYFIVAFSDNGNQTVTGKIAVVRR